jgi:TRAP-type C4-dicarboxylate transport system permease small subunit
MKKNNGMKNIINDVSNFISGQSNLPANPDITHNIQELIETKTKIESGIFTRFFKRPTIHILEIVAYAITAILFVAAILIWGKIDNFFDAADTINFVSKMIGESDLQIADYSWISYIILFIFLLPSLICFLLGRLLTKSRKRMKVFIEVEGMIERVIFNLKG